ncbi:MAG: MFS transporter [Thaumarchaeota archaeon]|nr:MFS transporter [Nitrososphaerota archaeon]
MKSPGKSADSHKSSSRSVTLALLVMAQFVVVLDFSIVQIALPTMRAELGISLADSQWIVSAYGLTFAGFLLLSGRLSDLYGRRRLFSIGLVLFALSSLAGGLAPSELVLIAARAVQGIGAAIASATGLSLIVVSFSEGPDRNRALSVFSAVSSAAFAAGVILGGVLTASLGWRSVFFINVPIGIIAALLTPLFIAESRGQASNRHLDLPGAASVTVGLSLLVYGLTEAANTSLSSYETLVPLALSVVVLSGFLIIEARTKAPLMPLSFLRRGTVFTANAIAILTISCMTSMIFLLTIYLQEFRGYSALSAGLAFLPTALVFLVVGGFLSARFVTRFGMKSVLVSSMVVLALGFFLLSRISLGSSYLLYVLPSMLVASLGAAFAFTAFNIAALSGAKQGEEGLASGLVNTSTQVGGPIGLAIAVTIASTIAAGLTGRTIAAATVDGFGYAFLGSTVMATVAVVFALALRVPKPTGAPAPILQTEQTIVAPTAQPRVGPASAVAAVGNQEMGIKKILLAVDGSENGQRAALTAMKLAKDYRAELLVLRVVNAPTALTPTAQRGQTSTIIQQFYDYAQKDATEYVDNIVAEARTSGVASVRGEVVRASSSPASTITEKAASEQADIIVIGSRGLDRPKRLFLGSVSSGVVADSEIQVLVVK